MFLQAAVNLGRISSCPAMEIGRGQMKNKSLHGLKMMNRKERKGRKVLPGAAVGRGQMKSGPAFARGYGGQATDN